MATILNSAAARAHSMDIRTPYIVYEIVDAAAIITAIGGALGVTDTIQVLSIPANTICLSAGFDVLTAESTNTTAQWELGDGADPNRYVLSRTCAVAGVASASVIATGSGFVYDAADTIDLLGSVDDFINCKLRVWALLADCTWTATVATGTWSV